MLLFIGMIFILLLGFILLTVYRRENAVSRRERRKASLEEYWSGKERRRHVRFKNRLEVDYTVEKKPRLKGYTVDISEGGLKVLIAEKLGLGSILGLTIALPDNRVPAKIEGEVVWCEEKDTASDSGERLFCSGIKFLAVKEPSKSSLIQYIRSLPILEA